MIMTAAGFIAIGIVVGVLGTLTTLHFMNKSKK